MQSIQRLIVPALGVVIVLCTFMLGVPVVFRVLLVLLGVAAVGTHFLPHAVQVETRIAIAALGLVILLIVSSTALWLAVLSFAAIAALQIPHRGTLERSLATVAWLETTLKAVRARRSGRDAAADGDAEEPRAAADGVGEEPRAAADGVGEEPRAATTARDEERSLRAGPAGIESLPGFVRVNVAGVAGTVCGVVALISTFLPWILVAADTVWGETVTVGLTLREAAAEWGWPALSAFFAVLVVLGAASIASMVLPRVVVIVIAGAGLAVAGTSVIYSFVEFNEAASQYGVSAVALPNVGPLLAGGCYLATGVLHLIPACNKTR